MNRAITPTWVARRVLLCGVTQDERLTETRLGRGTASDRAQLKVMLAGRAEVTVAGRSFDLGPGQFLLVPRLADCVSSGGDHEILELDWDDEAVIGRGVVTSIGHGTLDRPTLDAARSIASSLRGGAAASGRPLLEAFRALEASGLPFTAEGVAHELERAVATPEIEQRVFGAIDRALTCVSSGPAVVDLEAELGASRRTVSRHVRALHERYRLSGLHGESWRAVRDFYRVLLGTILASSPLLSTTALASVLGYGSPHALCHAFAHLGLPSPGSIGKHSPRRR